MAINPRTTEARVRDTLATDATIDVTEFINNASIVVSRVSTIAATRGKTLTLDELALIETYLAAHFYSLHDRQYKNKSTGKASAAFQVGRQGTGFKATDFGQQALAIDWTGALEEIDTATPTVGVYWVGTEE